MRKPWRDVPGRSAISEEAGSRWHFGSLTTHAHDCHSDPAEAGEESRSDFESVGTALSSCRGLFGISRYDSGNGLINSRTTSAEKVVPEARVDSVAKRDPNITGIAHE